MHLSQYVIFTKFIKTCTPVVDCSILPRGQRSMDCSLTWRTPHCSRTKQVNSWFNSDISGTTLLYLIQQSFQMWNSVSVGLMIKQIKLIGKAILAKSLFFHVFNVSGFFSRNVAVCECGSRQSFWEISRCHGWKGNHFYWSKFIISSNTEIQVICSVYLGGFSSRLLGLIKIAMYSSNLWVYLLFISA